MSAAVARLSADEVKRAATGRTVEILSAVAGIPAELLDPSREHPCPRCQGNTRFRLVDKDAGAVLCSHCFNKRNGDFLAAIQWMKGCSFPESVAAAADYLGLKGSAGNGHANGQANGHAASNCGNLPDPEQFAREVCEAKRIPIEAAERYGYQPAKHGKRLSLDCPMYGPDGKQCSTFRLTADSTGYCEKDKEAGLFLPHDESGKVVLPTKGETVCIVEGGKDSPALFAHGYYAVGLPTSSMNQKFAGLFRGVHAKIIPDLDHAGKSGAETTAKNLKGIAASVSIITLPGEFRESKGIDCRDVLAMDNGVELLREAIDAAGPQTVERCTLAELAADYPTLHRPVIDGLIREGETCNVIADPKVGKSWFAYLLALSVITGQRWLGTFQTLQGKVLLLDNELHKPTIVHRVYAVGKAMGLTPDQYDLDLEVISLRGKMMSLEDLSPTFDAIQPGEFRLVILDSKYRFATAGTSENDNAAETLLYNLVDQYADRTRASFVLIHHASKGDQGDKRVTDVGAGAGAQSRAADCHIILREHEVPGVAVLEAAVRSFPRPEPVALRWDYPLWEPADFDARKLRGRQSKAEQRQADQDREATEEVIKALRNGPATVKQIRLRTGFNKEKAEKIVFRLHSQGHVTAAETKIRGQKCDEYRLVE